MLIAVVSPPPKKTKNKNLIAPKRRSVEAWLRTARASTKKSECWVAGAVQVGWVRERERFRGSCLVIQSAGEGWYGRWGEGVRRWFTGVAARGEWEGARLSSEARAWSARQWCKAVRENSPAGEDSRAKVLSLKKVNFPSTRFTEHFFWRLRCKFKTDSHCDICLY